MALPFYITWEVRGGAGNDNNGGGWVKGGSGTDWSQQNAAQYALTTVTTAAANAICLSSSAAADMVGNICQIISGTNFIAGFYQIISVSAGVSFTLDRNCTTGAGALGVINIGGALATVQKAVTASQVQELQTIYLKASGTYTLTAVQTISFNLIKFIGYTTTRTDNGRATITTSTNSVSMFTNNGGLFDTVFQNILFTNTAGTPLYAFVSSNTSATGCVRFDNCKFTGFNQAVRGDNSAAFQINQLIFTNCEIASCVSDGVFNSNGDMVFAGCYIHDNGGAGVHVGTGGYGGTCSFHHCIIKSNTLSGYLNSNTATPPAANTSFNWSSVFSSAFISNGRSGIEIANTTESGLISWNTIYYNNTRYGIETQESSSDTFFLQAAFQDGRSNAYRLNGLGVAIGWPNPDIGQVLLTGDPFTNQAGNDFSLNNTAGAGAACRGAGFPGALAIGGTGFIDIGPLQSAAGGGGGTTYVIAPNVTNYLVDEEAEWQ